MTRTFKEVPIFTKKWKELGFNDDDLTEDEKKAFKTVVKILKGE